MPDKPLRFQSADSLVNWLLKTTPGQAILDRVLPEWLISSTAALETELRAEVDRRLARRAPCLIVCHADGLIEAYGNQLIVHFADVPRFVDRTDAEAFMQDSLTPHIRSLYLQRSSIHWYDYRTQLRLPYPYIRDIHDMKAEAERLQKEAERREALARQKYPNHKRLATAM